MTQIFADSFYYVALLLQADQSHQRVVEMTRQLRSPIITTAWVLIEVANTLSAPRFRASFLSLLDDLRADAEVTVIPADPELFELGLTLYRNRPDKEWSLTDCISFEIMEREGLTEALTSDHHFKQAGFIILFE